MTSPGCSKLKCPYCDGHLEVPAELVGEWTTCPHCCKEIPLDTPADLPPGFKPKEVEQILADQKQATKKPRRYSLLLIPAFILVPLLVLVLAFAWEPVGKTIGAGGLGVLGIILSVVVGLLVLFWVVCSILLPVFVYFIYLTLLKIERNTRPRP